MYGILTYTCLIFMVSVGKYISHMDPMDYDFGMLPVCLYILCWAYFVKKHCVEKVGQV